MTNNLINDGSLGVYLELRSCAVQKPKTNKIKGIYQCDKCIMQWRYERTEKKKTTAGERGLDMRNSGSEIQMSSTNEMRLNIVIGKDLKLGQFTQPFPWLEFPYQKLL